MTSYSVGNKKASRRYTAGLCKLFHVGVVTDVFCAVAVITLAPGAITEFKIRIFCIGSAADGTAVGIGRFWGSDRSLIGAGAGEMDNLLLR